MNLKAAYIVPHPPLAVPAVGRGQEHAIAATLESCREVARRIAAHAPAVLVFVSPHTAYYADWIYVAAGARAAGDFGQFGAPGTRFSLTFNAELRAALCAAAEEAGIPAGMTSRSAQELDHGIMVPLYFIEEARERAARDGRGERDQREEQDGRGEQTEQIEPAAPWRYQAVSVGGSALPRKLLLEFGRCVARAIEAQDKSVVLVVSGDLSHRLLASGPYGFDPAGPRFDEQFATIIEAGNLSVLADIDPQLAEDAGECGLSGFIMLAGALEEAQRRYGCRHSSELLSCEGPFGVGYGVAAFELEEGSPHEKR